MKNWITALLGNEPLVAAVGPVVILVAGYLLARGWLDSDTAQLIIGVVTAIGGGGAVLGARALVTPTAKLPDIGD